jgi:hypothetical protein
MLQIDSSICNIDCPLHKFRNMLSENENVSYIVFEYFTIYSNHEKKHKGVWKIIINR